MALQIAPEWGLQGLGKFGEVRWMVVQAKALHGEVKQINRRACLSYPRS